MKRMLLMGVIGLALSQVGGCPPVLYEEVKDPGVRVTTSSGEFVIRLDVDNAPHTTSNFVAYAAESFYEVIERFPRHTYLKVLPRSGRTHQIRVHMAAIGHPIVADALYGGRPRELKGIVRRQMLHAYRLTFRHPVNRETVSFTAPIPADMERLLTRLRSLEDGGL